MNSVKRASIPSIHLDTNACSGVRQDGGRRRRMVRCPSRTSSRDVNESSMNSGIPFFLWGPVSALPRSLFCRNVRTRCSRDEISVSIIHIEPDFCILVILSTILFEESILIKNRSRNGTCFVLQLLNTIR